jgi:flagellar biosynthetic protein FlhB
MAEESDLEKTEPASQRRLDKAREDGDVPRSRELSTCTMLFAAGAGLWFNGDSLMRSLNRLMASGLSIQRDEMFDMSVLQTRLVTDLVNVVIGFAPLALLLIVTALATPVLIGGWLFSLKALQPNFARLNPISGLGNMISTRAGVELLKASGKAVLVGSVAYLVIMHNKEAVFGLANEPVAQGMNHLGSLLWNSFLSITSVLIVIAMIDAPYQMYHYANKLKMTRQEIRQESKESEGDPHVKGRIRAQQREMARRRMMSKIPTADVVVTNPTHYAVALKYADGKMRAPRVVAKGADDVAARIRELAAEHNIPLLEAPPLARALYRHTELDDEIPEQLYTAVAEVLAYVFQLKAYKDKGGVRPDVPRDFDVPEHLDPLNEEKNNEWEVVP